MSAIKKVLNFVPYLVLSILTIILGFSYDVYAETDIVDAVFEKPVAVTAQLAEIEKLNAEPAYAAYRAPVRATTPINGSNHLEMPAIGVNSSVVSVGLNNIGEIAVPSSGVGMWNGGAQPGQSGVVFLDGHVFGVFSRLSATSVGSEFSLTWNGVIYNYRVADNQTYSLDYLSQPNGVWKNILYAPVGGSSGLNIMTCAGTPVGNTYSHRTVIYAYQI